MSLIYLPSAVFSRPGIIILFWLLAASSIFHVRPAYSQEGTGVVSGADSDSLTLNFVDAEIEGVAKVMSEITGKNIIVDPRVKGVVNIISANPIPRDLAYDVLLSSLRLQGFAAVEGDDLIRIVPEGDAKLYPITGSGPQTRDPDRGDQIQTRVFTLKHASAVQMVSILRPLIAPNNIINAYQDHNALLITDYANNLQRLAGIIHSIDQPSGTDPVVIPIQYASAVDVAASIRRMFSDPSKAQGATAMDPTQRFTVASDSRSNSLLVHSGDPSRLRRVRNFVALLDTPTSATGNIHVIHLKNAEAVVLAETLRAIYQGNNGDPAAAAASGPVTPMSAGAEPADTAQSSPGIIQADAATNSIIITANDATYNTLRAAVEKLDVRRVQVYVEALIVEITADRAAEFGIQWQDLSGLNKTSTQPFGGTNLGGPGQNIIDLSVNPASAAPGLNIGIVKGQVLIPGFGQIMNLGVLVRALESDNNANILSTPTLLTLDNEEASIVIGQNVPFITGQFASLTGAATTPTPFQTIERHDVGLTLRVTPQISEDGTVRLQIYQEVSSVQDSTNPAGVITNKRAVSTTVLVDDGEIVAIGGLIQDTVNDDVQKVPLLGDLPVLGALFRYENRSYNKTNLMIFLRPTVVRDSEGAGAFSRERYDGLIDEQERTRSGRDYLLPDLDIPSLPEEMESMSKRHKGEDR
ncbi:MAG: type II secretion system secretin GspD [Gammaproteobacteria bacterium]